MKATSSLEEKLSLVTETIKANSSQQYNSDDIKMAAMSFYNKLLAADAYSPSCSLRKKILLIKAEQTTTNSLPSDYGLSHVCSDIVSLSVAGNHASFITDDSSMKVASTLNDWFESQ